MPTLQTDYGEVPVTIEEYDREFTKVALATDCVPLGEAGDTSWVDTDDVTVYDKEEAVEKMRERHGLNEHREVPLAPGVWLDWDSESPPYVLISEDSPYYRPRFDPKDVTYWLNDYGETGDMLAQRAYDVLTEVRPNTNPEFHYDDGNSTDSLDMFHGYWNTHLG